MSRRKNIMTIYDYKVKTTNGSEVSLEDYKGKVVLVVNTATGCGFTPQYEGLEKIYKEYNQKGFEILDFPCNQFGHQAPGTDAEVANFCQMKYDTSFQTFAKIEVNGDNESPLYTYLKSEKGGLAGSKIKWNFTKFLVDRNGTVIKRYGSTTTPEKIAADIEKYL
jgi:glutathione peroxidase